MQRAGDTHNFGRSVRLHDEHWVAKPRSTFWEQLFLAEGSRFRGALDSILGDEPIADCMPRLAFDRAPNNPGTTLMERLRVDPILATCDLEYALEALGGLLAVSAWFGLEDLHSGNVMCGADKRTGKFVIFPIDIEVALSDIRLLSNIGLVHIDHGRQKIAGAAPLFNLIRKASPKERLAVPLGYMRTAKKLLLGRTRLAKALRDTKGAYSAPIRVVLRDTRDYVDHQEGRPLSQRIDASPFAPEERVQLDRGDVPYFFRTLKDPRIRYYRSADLRKTDFVSPDWAMARAKPLLQPKEIFGLDDRNEALYEQGAMMLVAQFMPRDFHGRLFYRNLFANALKRSIQIQFNSETLFKGPRDWSAFIVPL
jgi:hypothetical protein